MDPYVFTNLLCGGGINRRLTDVHEHVIKQIIA
jgi:hypothetical protein